MAVELSVVHTQSDVRQVVGMLSYLILLVQEKPAKCLVNGLLLVCLDVVFGTSVEARSIRPMEMTSVQSR